MKLKTTNKETKSAINNVYGFFSSYWGWYPNSTIEPLSGGYTTLEAINWLKKHIKEIETHQTLQDSTIQDVLDDLKTIEDEMAQLKDDIVHLIDSLIIGGNTIRIPSNNDSATIYVGTVNNRDINTNLQYGGILISPRGVGIYDNHGFEASLLHRRKNQIEDTRFYTTYDAGNIDPRTEGDGATWMANTLYIGTAQTNSIGTILGYQYKSVNQTGDTPPIPDGQFATNHGPIAKILDFWTEDQNDGNGTQMWLDYLTTDNKIFRVGTTTPEYEIAKLTQNIIDLIDPVDEIFSTKSALVVITRDPQQSTATYWNWEPVFDGSYKEDPNNPGQYIEDIIPQYSLTTVKIPIGADKTKWAVRPYTRLLYNYQGQTGRKTNWLSLAELTTNNLGDFTLISLFTSQSYQTLEGLEFQFDEHNYQARKILQDEWGVEFIMSSGDFNVQKPTYTSGAGYEFNPPEPIIDALAQVSGVSQRGVREIIINNIHGMLPTTYKKQYMVDDVVNSGKWHGEFIATEYGNINPSNTIINSVLSGHKNSFTEWESYNNYEIYNNIGGATTQALFNKDFTNGHQWSNHIDATKSGRINQNHPLFTDTNTKYKITTTDNQADANDNQSKTHTLTIQNNYAKLELIMSNTFAKDGLTIDTNSPEPTNSDGWQLVRYTHNHLNNAYEESPIPALPNLEHCFVADITRFIYENKNDWDYILDNITNIRLWFDFLNTINVGDFINMMDAIYNNWSILEWYINNINDVKDAVAKKHVPSTLTETGDTGRNWITVSNSNRTDLSLPDTDGQKHNIDISKLAGVMDNLTNNGADDGSAVWQSTANQHAPAMISKTGANYITVSQSNRTSVPTGFSPDTHQQNLTINTTNLDNKITSIMNILSTSGSTGGSGIKGFFDDFTWNTVGPNGGYTVPFEFKYKALDLDGDGVNDLEAQMFGTSGGQFDITNVNVGDIVTSIPMPAGLSSAGRTHLTNTYYFKIWSSNHGWRASFDGTNILVYLVYKDPNENVITGSAQGVINRYTL